MDHSEISQLKAQLAALQARIGELEASEAETRGNRRNMLKLAAGAAAGAVAGGLAFGVHPASAGGTVNVQLNQNNTASAPTRIIRPSSGYTSSGSGNNWGLLHLTSDVTQAGNTQTATSMLSIYNAAGAGMVSQSTSYGAKLDAPVPLKLLDTSESSGTIPTSGYKGQFRVYNGNLYFCVAATSSGGNAQWRRITGPTAAGSFHAISPVRVYDSRQSWATPNGVMTANTNITVSVANAYDNAGAVTNNVVPTGATAIAYNATVTGATGPNYLAVTPGDATTFTASAINFGAGVDVANASVVKLDSSRQIKVFCGDQTGSTHVIIDVVGYYL